MLININGKFHGSSSGSYKDMHDTSKNKKCPTTHYAPLAASVEKGF